VSTDRASSRWLRAAAYLPVYALCIGPAALFWHQPILLAVVYIVVSAGLLMWRHSSSDLVYYFVPFFLGPIGEIFAVQGGAWTYADDDLLFPIWLPCVWGIAGLFMKNVSESISGRQSDGERSPPDSELIPSAEAFRIVVTRVIVAGVASWVLLLLAFMGHALVVPQSAPEGWLLVLIHEHYAALVQVPVLALSAFFGVLLFGVVSGEQIEFKALGVEFRGAAGPVVLSIFSFLALVLATYLLWGLE